MSENVPLDILSLPSGFGTLVRWLSLKKSQKTQDKSGGTVCTNGDCLRAGTAEALMLPVEVIYVVRWQTQLSPI